MNRLQPSRLDSRAAFAAAALFLAFGTFGAGCSDDPEVECPDGFSRQGKLCVQEDREDSGEPVTAGERKDARVEDPAPGKDAGTQESEDSGSGSDDGGSTGQSDSGPDASGAMDAGGADASDAGDSGSKDGGSDGSTPECDSTHACPSSGYFCMANKCVSACSQTQCTANSTCGLVRGAPVCTCNSGYLPVTTGGRLTCTRDVACSDLDCDENASCELGSNQVRHCVCKAEYVGDGRNCTRVACPALSTLRIDNGQVSSSDGTTTVGKVAVFRCNDGYRSTSGGPLVCDESGKWTGTPTVCSPITCGKPTATVEHATLNMPDQTSYRPNQTAGYTCAQGYKPRGEANITCKNDGSWTAPGLSCVLACGDGNLDSAAPFNEECDPAQNPTSAWTCDAECKLCAGGVCRKSCNADSACPNAINNLNRACSSNACVLSNCNNSTRRCPEGAMCMGSSLQATCVATPATGS